MPALLIYLLKANIALALFFLAYRWGLRRLTFYVLNRFFLLTAIVCSSVFPLVDVNALLERHQQIEGVVEYVPDFSLLQAQPDTSFTIWQLLVYIFWTGVFVMGMRFILQLCSLWRIHRRSHSSVVQQQPVKVLNDPLTPFSFFRNIYINPSLHQPSELDAILRHELVHIKEWHTVDVIMAELNNIFYWFNPGAWLMRIAIRENLEFITDRWMLRQGIDPKAYQYNLIKVSGIPSATAIANNFNFSHLKNRIKMMNKKSSAKYNLLRYLVLGCVVAIALLSLNFSRAAFNSKRLSFVQDTIPPPIAPVAPVAPVAPPTPEQPAFAAIPVPPLPPAPVTGPAVATPPAPPKPPKAVLDTVPKPPPPPPVVVETSSPFPGLLIVDGVRKGFNQRIGAIVDHKDIETMNVWKNDKAIQRYGKDGEKGVIEITTKKGAGKKGGSVNSVTVTGYKADTLRGRKVTTVNVNENTNTNTDEHKNTNVVVHNAISLKGLDSTRHPLVIIDGKVKNVAALNEIPGERIKVINVFKGNDATTLYGEKAVNGLIQVTTRDSLVNKQ